MNKELSNKNLMLSVFRAFKEGDVEPLYAALSQDVCWKSYAPPESFRFGGVRIGRAEVKAHISLVLSQYHFIHFDPTLIVTQGELVMGQFEIEARHQRTNKIVQADISIRWTVRNRQIVEHQGFFDTAGVLMQQGDLVAA